MTTKVLTGTYSAGYALGAPITLLSIASGGFVGGAGVATAPTASAAYSVVNDGRIDATSGSDIAGIYLANGGTVDNDVTGRITGYRGVDITHDGDYGTHGGGYVTNLGSIVGTRAAGVSIIYGGVINGSAAAPKARITGVTFGVLVQGNAYDEVTVTNEGTILATSTVNGGGVQISGAGSLVNGTPDDQTARIVGYSGVVATSYLALQNDGVVRGTGTRAGEGVSAVTGFITNGSASDHGALIEGFVGLTTQFGADITNFGTIIGTGGVGIVFGDLGGQLNVEAGSRVVGAVIGGGGGVLDLASGAETITGLGGSGVMSGGASMTFSGFATYQLAKGATATLKSANLLGAVQNFSVEGVLDIGGTLTTAGELDLQSGTIEGLGTLVATGGIERIFDGVVSVGHWSLEGGGLQLYESLNFKGVFHDDAGSGVSVPSDDTLTLSGTAVLDGGLYGQGSVSSAGARVDGLGLAGGISLKVHGAINQSGVVTMDGATISILKTATWNIGVGSIAANGGDDRIGDFGVLIKNVGMGVSRVGVSLLDGGVVEAATGTLDMMGGLTGDGQLKIDAGAILEVDSSASRPLTASFNGADAVLALKAPTTFAATIAGFAATDTIDLLGVVVTGASVDARDQLVITNGASTVATLQMSGAYTGATFSVTSNGRGGTDITLAPPSKQPPSPRLLAQAMAGMAPAAGAATAPHDVTGVRLALLAQPAIR